MRERAALVEAILQRLEEVAPGSEAILRGSLAEGRADCYSDIDVLWEVSDDAFEREVARIEETLAGVRPIESLRSDPDFQRSAKRRLFFVRFAEVPLFWRLDLDVFARSAGRDPAFDVDNPAARGAAWSLTESALANAVAAVKAHARGRGREARDLLTRAYARTGLPLPHLPLRELILHLARNVARLDPAMRTFAAQIEALVAQDEWLARGRRINPPKEKPKGPFAT